MTHKTNVTGKKISITKSRSGHYTLTVRETGTWELNGLTFPLNRVVVSVPKLQLDKAQRLAAQYKAV
jgi:hypothetical protein